VIKYLEKYIISVTIALQFLSSITANFHINILCDLWWI